MVFKEKSLILIAYMYSSTPMSQINGGLNRLGDGTL